MYAHLGAEVTVCDISEEQLSIDREIAEGRGLKLRTIRCSMDDLGMLARESFDAVIQPVSTCYVPDVIRTYREVARVLIAGGIYISQHKTPTSLQGDTRCTKPGYKILLPYYTDEPLPQVRGSKHREFGMKEFLHRWEQLVGGLCRNGFVVEDLLEPNLGKADEEPGTFSHRSYFIAPYVRILARRRGKPR